jgi:hypothetical protein
MIMVQDSPTIRKINRRTTYDLTDAIWDDILLAGVSK